VVVDILPPERRGEGIGLFGLSMTLGMAMGPFAGLWLSREMSYETMFLAGGGLSLIGFALAAIVKVPALKHNTARRKFHEGLIEKTALPASLSVMLLIFAYGGLISFVSVYGKETGIGNTGIFFLIFAAGLGISRIISGKIFDRSGPLCRYHYRHTDDHNRIPVLALFPGYAGYCTSAFLLGAGNGIMISTFQAMVNNLVGPEKRGAANSTLFTAFDLGIGGGMIATGILADMITLRGSFIFSAAVTVSGLLLYLVYVHPHYRKNISHAGLVNKTEMKSVKDSVAEPEKISLEA
jgi:predicted MFS family arabinose efflux permease